MQSLTDVRKANGQNLLLTIITTVFQSTDYMNTLLTMESVYDSIEFAGRKRLRQYKKLLKKINDLSDHYRNMDINDLRVEALSWTKINLKDKKQIIKLYALAREVCFRLLGNFRGSCGVRPTDGSNVNRVW